MPSTTATPADAAANTTTGARTKLKLGEKVHPLYTASWASRFTWSWMFPLLFTGRRKQLDEDDVWELPTRMRARSVHERYAERCLKYPHMTLRQHMVRMFWPRWVVAGLCYVGWCVCAGAQPFLVSAIVSHLQDDNATTSDGAWLAFALFVSTLWYVDARSHPPTHPLSHQRTTHTNAPGCVDVSPLLHINKRASLQE
jgi:hypothetical protein